MQWGKNVSKICLICFQFILLKNCEFHVNPFIFNYCICVFFLLNMLSLINILIAVFLIFLSLFLLTANELLQSDVLKDVPRWTKLSQTSHQHWREERATPKETRGDYSRNRRIAWLHFLLFFYLNVQNV